MRLGVSKVDITPANPIPLAGFAHRSGNFEKVVSPLYAKIFLFDDVLLVTADLIWWGSDLVQDLQKSIGIPSFFHATHNHSGPQTSEGFVPSLGQMDQDYIERLKKQIHQGILKAKENLEEVTVEVGKGLWSEGIHRRKIIDGHCEMAPNPEGPNDQSVTVIKFLTGDRTKAMLVHATCHPTTMGGNVVSTEYPGVAMEGLESRFNVVAGFLQGFCGDIRPAMIKNNAFYRGDQTDVERIGLSLLETVLMVETKKCSNWLSNVITKTIDLLFSKKSEEAEIRAAKAAQLKLSYLSLAENLSFLTANAEMVVEYGLAAKEIFGESLLPLGYTNGMIGYVPTEKQLEEGGYEAAEAPYYFAFPSPFSPEIEGMILQGLREIREEI
jgi:hypothetical protein